MKAKKKFFPLLIIMVAVGVLLFYTASTNPAACQNVEGCRQLAVTTRQPLPTEMSSSFDKAGLSKLGAAAPALPSIYKGYPTYTKVPGVVPCALLKSVAYVESGWKQFRAGFDEVGPTLISPDCGFGVMQITTYMHEGDPLPSWDPARVAAEPEYNIGTGALFLVNKWNSVPNFVGDNNPLIVEDWYYAVWAYNGFGWVNNPNNPKFPSSRLPFTGTQLRSQYPYQELVFGYLANPPAYNSVPFWTALPATLPNRTLITDPPPKWIARPLPFHISCGLDISNFLPGVLK
jgi:hypothetical protein